VSFKRATENVFDFNHLAFNIKKNYIWKTLTLLNCLSQALPKSTSAKTPDDFE